MNITKPKFKPKQKVYANLKSGMELCTIESVLILITEETQTIRYYLKESYSESYYENQITENHKEAVKRLEENKAQLQLALN